MKCVGLVTGQKSWQGKDRAKDNNSKVERLEGVFYFGSVSQHFMIEYFVLNCCKPFLLKWDYPMLLLGCFRLACNGYPSISQDAVTDLAWLASP